MAARTLGPWLASIMAGLLLGLAPIDGLHGLVLRLIGCAVLGLAVQGRPLADLSRGAMAGLLWYGTSLLWFPLTWARFDSLGDPWLAYAGLIGLQALPLALALGVAGLLVRRRLSLALSLALALPAAHPLAEVVQPLPAGLPVYLAGHPALLWPAALGGSALLLAVLGAWIGAWRRPLYGLLLTGVWITGALVALPDESEGIPLQIGLVQPNVGPLDGRRASTADLRADALLTALHHLGERDVALALTPEGAWPHDPGAAHSHRRDKLLAALSGAPPTLLGASIGDGALPTNSLLAVDGGRVVARYDKRSLLPLGERSVLGFGRDTYRPGVQRPALRLAGVSIAARICYEDLLTTHLRDLGDAELLVTPSNDGWLGPGAGSRAHEAASRLAAVQTGRWVVRPTTNGRSAVFDPSGRRHLSLDWVEGDVAPRPSPQIAVATVRRRAPAQTGADRSPWIALLAALLALALATRAPRAALHSTTDPEITE